jgi:hypothetical protein
MDRIENDSRRAWLERQVAWTEVTRTLGKHEELTTAHQVIDGCVERTRVVAAKLGIALVVFAHDGDAREEEAPKPAANELPCHNEDGAGKDALVEHTVDGAVAMQTDVQYGTIMHPERCETDD